MHECPRNGTADVAFGCAAIPTLGAITGLSGSDALGTKGAGGGGITPGNADPLVPTSDSSSIEAKAASITNCPGAGATSCAIGGKDEVNNRVTQSSGLMPACSATCCTRSRMSFSMRTFRATRRSFIQNLQLNGIISSSLVDRTAATVDALWLAHNRGMHDNQSIATRPASPCTFRPSRSVYGTRTAESRQRALHLQLGAESS